MPLNYVEAVKWFRKAAEQGHAEAQFELGGKYFTSEGVPEDNVEAYTWYLLAKANGDERASGMISVLEKNFNFTAKCCLKRAFICKRRPPN